MGAKPRFGGRQAREAKCLTFRLTKMEVENPLFGKESSRPWGHCPLPCQSSAGLIPYSDADIYLPK